jgi:hypothetical protein
MLINKKINYFLLQRKVSTVSEYCDGKFSCQARTLSRRDYMARPQAANVSNGLYVGRKTDSY